MSSEKTLRAFLAMAPPQEILEGIRNIQNLLKKSCPPDIRWTKPEGIHLTLKFFGDIFEKDIPAISGVVEKHASVTLPIHLQASMLGVFPSVKRPRVLWIGIKGDLSPVVSLQKKLEEEFEACGFAREERTFSPHLTIGRIKAACKQEKLENILETGRDWTAGSFLVLGLGLFKSDLTPRGAIYTKLAWFPFESKQVH